jgi:hypothetical protein
MYWPPLTFRDNRGEQIRCILSEPSPHGVRLGRQLSSNLRAVVLSPTNQPHGDTSPLTIPSEFSSLDERQTREEFWNWFVSYFTFAVLRAQTEAVFSSV